MTTRIIVDPGESTGVALFDGALLVRCFTTHSPHDELRQTLREHPGADVIRETSPEVHRHAAECIDEVERLIDAEATGLVYPVKPSQWKGHPFAALRDTDNPSNAHERDAVSLGRWFLAMRRHNALSIRPLDRTAAQVQEFDPVLTEAERGRLEAELNAEHFEQPH